MSDEPDILEGFPDLLDIAYRREQYLAERKGKVFNTQWADDVATLLAAVRSLIQQTRDLRADEGDILYRCEGIYTRGGRHCFSEHDCFSDAQEAMKRHIAAGGYFVSYEIVSVRRLVITKQANRGGTEAQNAVK